VLLLDEATSALDPISTLQIEELIRQLVEEYTIIAVTHNMQQAARVSDFTAFLLGDEHGVGRLIELARQIRFSQSRRTSARKTTSPDGSAENGCAFTVSFQRQ